MKLRTKKTSLWIVLMIFLTVGGSVFAAAVTLEDSIKAVRGHRESKVQPTKRTVATSVHDSSNEVVTEITDSGGKVLAYVHSFSSGGYVVTSADDVVSPILAESKTGVFPKDQNHPIYDMIRWDVHAKLKFKDTAQQETEWDNYIAGDVLAESLAETLGDNIYGPLIQTHWYQTGHFNDKCPLDPETDKRCVVGCVATAMGQIVNYWEYPKEIIFSSTDNYSSHGKNGEFSIFDTATSLDYPSATELSTSLSSISYSGDTSEEAYLCFGLGVKLSMGYSSSGSGSFLGGFREVGFGSALNRNGSWDEYREKTIENIKNGMPVQIGMFPSTGGGGHSVIIDGYRESDGWFHINYGWGDGDNDIWYNLPNAGNGYSVIRSYIFDVCSTHPWMQYGSDAKNTFRAGYPISETVPNRTKAAYSCTAPGLNHSYEGVCVGAGGNVYLTLSPNEKNADKRGMLWVLDSFVGKKLASVTLADEDSNLTAPAADSKGNVFFAGSDGGMYRFSYQSKTTTKLAVASGNDFWHAKTDEADWSYFSGWDYAYCFDQSGNEKWHYKAPSGYRIYSAPAVDVDKGNVYVGISDYDNSKAYLLCINRATGQTRFSEYFEHTKAFRYLGAPSIGEDGTVYVGYAINIYALRPNSSSFTELGKVSTDSKLTQAPAIGRGDSVYMNYWVEKGGQWYYRIAALSKGSLSLNWNVDIPEKSEYQHFGQIYVAPNNVIVMGVDDGSGNNCLYAYRDNGSSATKLWEKTVASSADFAWGATGEMYVLDRQKLSVLTSDTLAYGDPYLTGMGYENNEPPVQPFNPNHDKASDVPLNTTLSWSCSDPDGHDVKYDVFLGAGDAPAQCIAQDFEGNSVSLTGLVYGTVYRWGVNATDGQALSVSDIWTFETEQLIIYTLTVNNGSGDDSYEENAQVNISADQIGGQVFKEWTVSPSQYASNLGSATAPSTTFTMPATNVTVTAAYRADGPSSWQVNPSSTNHSGAAENGSFSVSQLTGADADWTPVLSAEAQGWVTIDSYTGNGGGEVQYSVDWNDTGAQRQGFILVGNARFTVTQEPTLAPVSLASSVVTVGDPAGDYAKIAYGADGFYASMESSSGSAVAGAYGFARTGADSLTVTQYMANAEIDVIVHYTFTSSTGGTVLNGSDTSPFTLEPTGDWAPQSLAGKLGGSFMDDEAVQMAFRSDGSLPVKHSVSEDELAAYTYAKMGLNTGEGTVNTDVSVDYTFVSSSNVVLVVETDDVPAETNTMAMVLQNGSLFWLDVELGTGDGAYAPGETVSIAADDAADGYQFDAWTGSGAASVTTPTMLTMPSKDIAIMATYEIIPPTWMLAPDYVDIPGSATSGSITLTQIHGPPDSSWTALVVSGSDWLNITTGAEGTGNGSVSYSVVANESGRDRSGEILAANETFSVEQAPLLPSLPTNPNPSSGATDVDRTVTLSWDASDYALGYEVWFAKGADTLTKRAMLSSTSYNTGLREADAQFHWKVVATNEGGSATGGPWLFTTEDRLTPDETFGTSGIDWSHSGAASWFPTNLMTHLGVLGSVAQSGAIGDGQSSVLEATVVGPGTMDFWWKVSSEENDFLNFYIGTNRIDGIVGIAPSWMQESVSVPDGVQTLSWKYEKDGSGSSVGTDDCGWLDDVQWQGENSTTFPLSGFADKWVATYLWDKTANEWIVLSNPEKGPTEVVVKNIKPDQWYWLCVMEYDGTNWNLAHGSWISHLSE